MRAARRLLRALLLASTCLLLTATPPAFAGGAITSGSTVNGTLSGPGYSETWTFTGTVGDRVIIDAVTTSGTANTNIMLKSPASSVVLNSSSGDRAEFQLTSSGTWTIVIDDVGNNEAGNYSLTFLDIISGPLTSGGDADGGPIASGEIKTGANAVVSDMDAFTFTGTAGHRILVGAIATAGASYNTVISVYPPNGGAAEWQSSGDQADLQLAASGTYTIVIEDFNDDHTGNYSLSLLDVTSGPFTTGTDTDGGTIASAEIKNATTNAVGDFDAWSFSATAGQRVILTAVATGGSNNTNIQLYPPNGGAATINTSADRVEQQITTSGTWTVVITDLGQDATGGYTLSLLKLQGGPLSFGADPDSGAIASNQIRNGNISSIADMDAFTFSGVAGQRVLIAAIATGGASFNTTVSLYPPNGAVPEIQTTGDRFDTQLLQSGTYTIVVEDYNDDNTGSYALSLYNVTAGPLTSLGDTDGGTIASSDVVNGTIGAVGDFDGFKFPATVGQRVLINALATSGALNTNITLFPPFGGAPVTSTSADQVDVQITATGMWTVVIEDVGNDATGDYTLSMLNIQGGPFATATDADTAELVSDVIHTGTTSPVTDMDAWHFTVNAGDRVRLSAIATGGASYNTVLVVYPPNGGAYEASTTADVLDFQAAMSGTYTLVVEDYNLDHTGTYTLSYENVTAGPWTSGGDPDGGTIASAETHTGSMQSIADLDCWRFTGTVGQRVLINALTTGGAMNTNLTLYPPGGLPAATTTSGDQIDFQLTATGTWTVVIEDVGEDATGSYALTMLNLQGGPLTTGGDPDGGPIVSGTIATGSNATPADMDGWTFTGTAGDRVILNAISTSAAPYNTVLVAYPPNGAAAEASTTADRLDFVLQQSGTYVVVVEDYSLDDTGTYALSYTNLTAGPVTSLADPDGGATVASDSVVTGHADAVGDMDVWRFRGTAGDRVLIGAFATGGTMNTQVTLYPPGNGPYITSTSADRIDVQLTATGTWTMVVEDAGEDATGDYTLTWLDVTSGKYTHSGDGDGGILASNQIRSGTMQSVVDFDGYRFFGTAGDRVLIDAVATAGAGFNTTISLYPPNGGPAENTTAGDVLDGQLLQTGFYTIVVEDYGFGHLGTYDVSMVDLTAGPLTSGGDPDGGPLAPFVTKDATLSAGADLDTWYFYAVQGDTLSINAFTTTGTVNTNTRLYPPFGGPPVINTTVDGSAYTVATTGYHTLVISDATFANAGPYHLRLTGHFTSVDVPKDTPVAMLDPVHTVLPPSQPNPFGAHTRLTFSLPAARTVTLAVYDLRGARVRTIAQGAFGPGIHTSIWDGRDERGRGLEPGVYYADLVAGAERVRRKLVKIE